MKTKFIFFNNFKATADKLPDELRLKFYDAITDYVFKGVDPEDPVIGAILTAIKPSLDKEEGRGGAREGSGAPKNNQNAKNQSNRNNKTIKNNQKQSKQPNETKDIQNNQSFQEIRSNKQEIKENNTLTGITKENPEDDGIVDIEELIAKMPPKKRFSAPSIEDVQAYINEKKLIVNGQVFFDYFTAGNWKDSEGKAVKNWKQKLITWDDRERRKRTLDAARGLLNTGVKSGTYGKDAPL